MRKQRLLHRFPTLELLLSLVGHLFVGGTIVIFEAYFGVETPQVEPEPEDDAQYVQVTQVNLAKKTKGLPDKASQKPRKEPREKSPNEPRSESTPDKRTKPESTPTPTPRTETESTPSYEDIMNNLPTASEAPEGPEDREATSSEGDSEVVVNLSSYGPSNPLSKWWTVCNQKIWALASRGLVPTQVQSLDDAATLILEFKVAKDGRLSELTVVSSINRSIDRPFKQAIQTLSCDPLPEDVSPMTLQAHFTKYDMVSR